ncbi:MAG: PAS domain S-box protein [Nitrospirota bacterium]|nr:PAS domain S-box protein [Nitrospirota bacterium]
MTQIPMNQRRSISLAIALGAAAAYELAFAPLYQIAGDVVAAFTVIPVAVVGWLLGARAGLIAGLLGSSLNILNFTLVGQIGWEVVIGRWPAVLVSLAVGGMAGWAGKRAARATREFREANQERDKFFDLSMDLLCIAGTNGYFKRLNPAWERALGFSREELCSKPFIEFIHPDDRSRTQEVMEKLSRGEPAINFENRYRCHDGSYRWLTWNTPAPEQEPPMFYAAARDITERKLVEEALRESEERYRLLTDATFDGIAIHDQGIMIEASSGLERMFGYGPGELIGKHVLDLVADESREMVIANMKQGGQGPYESVGRRKDGSIFYGEVVVKPYRYKGRDLRLVAGRDITERKQMEQALRQANDELEERVAQRTKELLAANDALCHARAWQRDLIEAIPGIVWECNARTWRFSFVNHQAELVLGYPVQRWLDEPGFWQTHIHRDDRDWVIGYCLASLRDTRKYSFEYRMIAADGRTVWLQDIVTVENAEQGPAILRGIMLDITERKRAEEALRESEARFRSLFEEVPIAYQSLDIEGRYLDANKGLCTLLGYSSAELLGKPFDDFWPTDARQFFPDELSRFMRNGGETKHIRLRRKDGKEIAVILNGRVQRDLKGNFVRAHCILTDITDQKLIEENLRRSKIFIDSVLENLPSMIFVKDAKDLRFFRFNKAGEELLGYRRDELLGKNDYDIFPKEEADFFITKDREVLRSGCLLDIAEEPIQTRGNGLRFLHTKKIPICGTDGAPQYLLGISEDITDRKQAEEALQQNEARLNVAQRIAHIGSWDLDLVENVLTWSDENYRIFEIDPVHFRASYAAFLELVHPADRQFVNESYTESVANRTCYNIEHRLLMSDGRVKFIHEQCETFYAPDGRPTRSIGTTQDITDRKQAEEALRKSEEQLRKVLEEREQLSQDLHDNIIQSIYAIGMSLEECRYLFQEDYQAADKKLEHAVASLNRVISDVRIYIVWDKHDEINGQQFCAKLAELAVTMESMQGIHFSLDLAVGAAQRLAPLGTFHILHIVQEAMSNSLRHSKSRSGHVSLQIKNGRICLEITDEGVGFDLEGAVGLGHGLQNMAARAHKLGANFQIISQPGSGARILVELPLEDQHARASS